VQAVRWKDYKYFYFHKGKGIISFSKWYFMEVYKHPQVFFIPSLIVYINIKAHV